MNIENGRIGTGVGIHALRKRNISLEIKRQNRCLIQIQLRLGAVATTQYPMRQPLNFEVLPPRFKLTAQKGNDGCFELVADLAVRNSVLLYLSTDLTVL